MIPNSLRIGFEPFMFVTEREVHERLTRDSAGYIDYLYIKLTSIADGTLKVDMPPKRIFEDASGGGDFRVMPCVVGGMKTVKIVGTNRRQWTIPQITVGKLVVLDEIENFVTHIFDACLLSSARTAAVAALAIRRLAHDRRRVVIVGAGRIGYYAALYADALGVEEITFCDRVEGRARAMADDVRELLPHARVFVSEYRDIPGADVLVLATDSDMPIYRFHDFPADLVISVGADCDGQSEIADDVLEGAQIFVDHPHSARCGDLMRWLRLGRVRAHSIRSFLDDMRPGSGRKIFISTGSALFDNLTVAYYLGAKP